MLHPARSIPLPDLSPILVKKRGSRRYPIDTTHPLYTEGWVDLTKAGLRGVNYYHAPNNPPYYQSIAGSIPQLYARASVAEKLLAVDAALAPYDLALFIYDSWRPIEVQNYFHDVWMPAFLCAENPSLGGDALWTEVERYWARGAADGKVDPASPPPHYTGGAIDLTLCYRTSGEPLYMGGLFDDATRRSATDFYEHHVLDRSFSDLEAQANRRVLYHSMTATGFINLPHEWWHYSWGDQGWAAATEAPAAFYGPMTPSETTLLKQTLSGTTSTL